MGTSWRWIGNAMLWLGSVGFLWGLFALYTESLVPGYVEFPLGYMGSFAVDSNSRIYCGTQFYGRVQIYDAAGRFVSSHYVEVGGGRFQLDVDDDDNLIVVGARNQVRYTYDHEMNLLSQRPDPGGRVFKELEKRRGPRYRDRHGTSYISRDLFLLYPHIVKIDRFGESRVVVRTPLYLWPLMGPVLNWLLLGTGWWIYVSKS